MSDEPRIESRADLLEAFERGIKPQSDWRIGTEHEKILFHRDPLRPTPYDGPTGIGALLAAIRSETGWAPVTDGGRVVGLRSGSEGGDISLEPGGQLELSGAPLADLHQTAAELDRHFDVLTRAARPLGVHLLGLGLSPVWGVDEIPLMPKSRYAIMKAYMDTVGALGTTMMLRSSTIQANVDFSSESDMVRKLRVSLALQPVATALFANSPFADGRETGFLSYRAHAWQKTDRRRTGILPFAFDRGFGFEQYVDFAVEVPMYFVIRDGRYINLAGRSFSAFLRGELADLPGEKPTRKDWDDHLSTVFPEVRLRQVLEMRGADMSDESSVVALAALWTGLLYDETALSAAEELIAPWTADDRERMHRVVPTMGLATRHAAGTVLDVATLMVEAAESGLRRRGKVAADGFDESRYLDPLRRTIDLGITPAERLLKLFRGEWAGDAAQVFGESELRAR